MSVLWIYTGLFGVGLLLTGLGVWVGAKIFKAKRSSFLRAMLVGVIIGLVPTAVQIAGLVVPEIDIAATLVLGGSILLAIVIAFGVIRWLCGTTTQHAMGIWLITVVPSLGFTGLLLGIIEPQVAESFSVPSHSMAPTLLGPHRVGMCPDGEGVASTGFAMPDDTSIPVAGICHHTRAPMMSNLFELELQSPDVFIANKLRMPQRWDVVVFYAPEPRNPNARGEVTVKRLVGLPGEEVEIGSQGRVWINGEPLELPPHLANQRYGQPPGTIGPVQLGPDEMYVLGDFSLVSHDSRYWGGIPMNNLIGVAEVICWPEDRWGPVR